MYIYTPEYVLVAFSFTCFPWSHGIFVDFVEDELISPCMCKGTQQFVHRSCLDHWRSVKVNACVLVLINMKTYNSIPSSSGSLINGLFLIFYFLFIRKDLLSHIALLAKLSFTFDLHFLRTTLGVK